MRAGLTDPHIRLLRRMREWISTEPWFAALEQEGARPSLAIESFDSEPWASLTFSGMRHVLDIQLSGAGLEVEKALADLQDGLLESDLGIVGHFLAELQISEKKTVISADGYANVSLRLEALTIEE